jgi:hypothetical protein
MGTLRTATTLSSSALAIQYWLPSLKVLVPGEGGIVGIFLTRPVGLGLEVRLQVLQQHELIKARGGVAALLGAPLERLLPVRFLELAGQEDERGGGILEDGEAGVLAAVPVGADRGQGKRGRLPLGSAARNAIGLDSASSFSM